jgi:hypothetical protein
MPFTEDHLMDDALDSPGNNDAIRASIFLLDAVPAWGVHSVTHFITSCFFICPALFLNQRIPAFKRTSRRVTGILITFLITNEVTPNGQFRATGEIFVINRYLESVWCPRYFKHQHIVIPVDNLCGPDLLMAII